MPLKQRNFYVAGSSSFMRQLLRRTLVLWGILLGFYRSKDWSTDGGRIVLFRRPTLAIKIICAAHCNYFMRHLRKN